MNINVNGQIREISSDWRDESLLNVLREPLGLVGAKFGCGVGLCGACSVLIEGESVRSCLVAVRDVGDQRVVTVEGLARGETLHPVQQAWLDEAVPQCGYCQAGQIISTVALLKRVQRPSDMQIDDALAGNLCRCGTQQRIRKAVHRAARTAS